MTILSRHDSFIFVLCPCSLLTLCHHSQFVYGDDDDDDDDDEFQTDKIGHPIFAAVTL